MMNYTITKDFGTGKANADLKARLTEIVTNALITEFGEDNVKMVRTGTSTEVNEIGIRAGVITDIDGMEYDFCATINPTVKSFKEKVTKRYTVEPFDFDTAAEKYTDYIEANRIEAEKKAQKKAEKIARDKAARAAKAKANAERLAEGTEGEEEKRYVVVVDPGHGSLPFVFARDTEDTENCTRTLENAKAWKDALEMDYPDGTAKIYDADVWYKNNK